MKFAIILLSICAFILKAYIFIQMWDWFAVPTGLPILTIQQSLGLFLMIFLLSNKSHLRSSIKKETEPQQDLEDLFSFGVVLPLMILLISYIITLFM